jgi:Fe2+ or Zn2+ uptake regulation protein
VLEQLGSATAYEIWKHLPDASLRGVYKAIKTLVSEGVVCEEPSTKGRRKVMLYKLCS